MEFRHLRYFMALAEEGNFGRAAKRVHISQPPLTRQIRQLEEEFGARLFERTPKGVELTEAGRLFREEAVKILALAQLTGEKTRMAARGELGRLDVGIFGSAVLDVIPRLILEFRRRYPAVEVHLHNMTRPAQIQALQAGYVNFYADDAVVFDFKPSIEAGAEMLGRRGEDERLREERPAAQRRRDLALSVMVVHNADGARALITEGGSGRVAAAANPCPAARKAACASSKRSSASWKSPRRAATAPRGTSVWKSFPSRV